jgi:hypothetical protein
LKLHYLFQPNADTLFAGVQTLGDIEGTAHGIENIPGGSGQINMSDGFSEEEKRISLKVFSPEAGMAGNGTDVITVTGAGPFNVPAGGNVRIGFAIHLAKNETELFQQAAAARNYYLNVVGPLTSKDLTVKNDLVIYPNPASRIFHISSQADPESIMISDFSGRTIADYLIIDSRRTFDLPTGIERGIYLVKIKTKTGLITKKLLIESGK